MGKPDHRHFGRHHRVWCLRHFFDTGQQHLPHAGQGAHWQGLGQAQSAHLLVRRNGWILSRIWGYFNNRNPMGNFGQIAHHGQRICAIGILPAQFAQRRGGIAAHNHFEQIHHPAAICQSQHCAHLLGRGFSSAMADRLIQKRCGIPG